VEYHAVDVAVAVAVARRNEDLRLFCLVECDKVIDRDTFLSKNELRKERKRKGKGKGRRSEGGWDRYSQYRSCCTVDLWGQYSTKRGGHTRSVLTPRRGCRI
jgi:hypothetical protein